MGKHSVKSTTVTCPLCNKEVNSRGLHAHLRLSHPEVDAMTYLRKRVISRPNRDERVVLQVSKNIDANTLILKWANLTWDDLESLRQIFDIWEDKGHPAMHPGYRSRYEQETQGQYGVFTIDEESDVDIFEEDED
jgi:hypothetical protein